VDADGARAAVRAPSRLLAVVALALATVFGIVGVQSGARAASANRACGLLTTKQVKAVLGAPVGNPKASKSGGHPACDWQTTTSSGARKGLSLAILPLGKAERTKFDDLADEDANLVVDDLGDQAVIECSVPRADECLSYGRLWVTVDDEYLGLSVSGVTAPDDEADALERLARQAVKEL
jgi:hypothetical protein